MAVIGGDEREKKEAIEVLRKQLNVESQLVRLYGETVNELQSSAVKHMLHMIALDSMKHIDTCQTAIEVLEGQDVLKAEKAELAKGLQRHIELEEESIEVGNKLLKNPWIKDTKGLNELVKRFRDDEKEHHETLKKLSKSAFFRLDSMSLGTELHDVDWLEERYVLRKRIREKYFEKKDK